MQLWLRVHDSNTVGRPLLMAAPEMCRVPRRNPRRQRYRAFYDRVATAVRREQKQPPTDADHRTGLDWTGQSVCGRKRQRATHEKRAVVRRCLAVNTGDKTVDLRARMSDVLPSICHCPVDAQLAF